MGRCKKGVQPGEYGHPIEIIVNIFVFVGVNMVKLIMYMASGGVLPEAYQSFLHFFCMSADWKYVLLHPWTILTHMFLHEGLWHIVWNMLFLFWFGRIFSNFLGERRVLPLYLAGGLAGALAYFVSANLLTYGVGSYALGASAAIMAITAAAGAIAPNYEMRLLFIGDVKLKYIVAVLIFLDIISIPNGSNTGGHFAHLGGALFGFLYINRLQSGIDYLGPITRVLDKFFNWWNGIRDKFTDRNWKKSKTIIRDINTKRSGEAKSDKKSPPRTQSDQERLDAILDKIKDTGYEGLSDEEKAFLYEQSKK